MKWVDGWHKASKAFALLMSLVKAWHNRELITKELLHIACVESNTVARNELIFEWCNQQISHFGIAKVEWKIKFSYLTHKPLESDSPVLWSVCHFSIKQSMEEITRMQKFFFETHQNEWNTLKLNQTIKNRTKFQWPSPSLSSKEKWRKEHSERATIPIEVFHST